jgi:hypothetical protein
MFDKSRNGKQGRRKRERGGRECLSIEQRTSKTALKYHRYNLGCFSLIFFKPSIFIRFPGPSKSSEKFYSEKF